MFGLLMLVISFGTSTVAEGGGLFVELLVEDEFFRWPEGFEDDEEIPGFVDVVDEAE